MSDVDLEHARSLVDLGRFAEAKPVLGQALARVPDDEDALILLGRAHFGCGEFREAVATAGRVLRSSPDEPQSLRLAALAHSALGEHDLARDAAMAAVRAAPGAAESHVVLAEVSMKHPYLTGDAMVAAETAVRLAPWWPGAHITLGNVQRKHRQLGKAKEAYETALRLDPQSSAAQQNLAVLGLDQGRAGRSAATLTRVLRNDPDNANAARNLIVSVALAMRNIRVGLFLPFFVLLAVDAEGFAPSATVTAAARGVAAILALAIGVGYAALVLRRGGPGLRRFVVGLLRRDAMFAVCVGLLALTVALIAIAPLYDIEAEGGGAVYTVSLLVGTILTLRWSRSTRRLSS